MMIPASPNCVYITNSHGQADVVAAWLQQHDVAARVISNTSLGGVPELILWSGTETASGGFEVWAPPQDVDAAKALIVEWTQQQSQTECERASKGAVVARCESCGTEHEYAADRRGKVEVCPRCDSFLDVPE